MRRGASFLPERLEVLLDQVLDLFRRVEPLVDVVDGDVPRIFRAPAPLSVDHHKICNGPVVVRHPDRPAAPPDIGAFQEVGHVAHAFAPEAGSCVGPATRAGEGKCLRIVSRRDEGQVAVPVARVLVSLAEIESSRVRHVARRGRDRDPDGAVVLSQPRMPDGRQEIVRSGTRHEPLRYSTNRIARQSISLNCSIRFLIYSLFICY